MCAVLIVKVVNWKHWCCYWAIEWVTYGGNFVLVKVGAAYIETTQMVTDKLNWNFHPKKRFLSSPFSFLSCPRGFCTSLQKKQPLVWHKWQIRQGWETGSKSTAGKAPVLLMLKCSSLCLSRSSLGLIHFTDFIGPS